jgi:hypothetical protein
VPIGHVRLDPGRKALVADVDKEHIKKFPGFDLDEFDKWSDADFDQFSRNTTEAFEADVVVVTTEPAGDWSSTSHYRRPDWWDANYYRPDRAGAEGVTSGARMSGADGILGASSASSGSATSSVAGGTGTATGSTVTGSTVTGSTATGSTATGSGSGTSTSETRDTRNRTMDDREAVMARGDDSSNSNGERAQPGDVIGVETGGERTYVGDTSEDEDKRRVEAEKAASKLRES